MAVDEPGDEMEIELHGGAVGATPSSPSRPTDGDPVRVVVSDTVLAAMASHVNTDTTVEQGGVLVGHFDEAAHAVLITDAIPALKAVSQAASLRFTHETWDYVGEVMDRDFPGEQLVGWYHSHPHFGIFLSDYDQFIHVNFFNQPWQVAYVIDPLLAKDGWFGWADGQLVRYGEWERAVVVTTDDLERGVGEPPPVEEKPPLVPPGDPGGRTTPNVPPVSFLVLGLVLGILAAVLVSNLIASDGEGVDDAMEPATGGEAGGERAGLVQVLEAPDRPVPLQDVQIPAGAVARYELAVEQGTLRAGDSLSARVEDGGLVATVLDGAAEGTGSALLLAPANDAVGSLAVDLMVDCDEPDCVARRVGGIQVTVADPFDDIGGLGDLDELSIPVASRYTDTSSTSPLVTDEVVVLMAPADDLVDVAKVIANRIPSAEVAGVHPRLGVVQLRFPADVGDGELGQVTGALADFPGATVHPHHGLRFLVGADVPPVRPTDGGPPGPPGDPRSSGEVPGLEVVVLQPAELGGFPSGDSCDATAATVGMTSGQVCQPDTTPIGHRSHALGERQPTSVLEAVEVISTLLPEPTEPADGGTLDDVEDRSDHSRLVIAVVAAVPGVLGPCPMPSEGTTFVTDDLDAHGAVVDVLAHTMRTVDEARRASGLGAVLWLLPAGDDCRRGGPSPVTDLAEQVGAGALVVTAVDDGDRLVDTAGWSEGIGLATVTATGPALPECLPGELVECPTVGAPSTLGAAVVLAALAAETASREVQLDAVGLGDCLRDVARRADRPVRQDPGVPLGVAGTFVLVAVAACSADGEVVPTVPSPPGDPDSTIPGQPTSPEPRPNDAEIAATRRGGVR